jgi:hypothetical protein
MRKVVQPLAGRLGIDTDHPRSGRRSAARGFFTGAAVRRWFAPYNVFHLRSVL